jgi:hypothetical protein
LTQNRKRIATFSLAHKTKLKLDLKASASPGIGFFCLLTPTACCCSSMNRLRKQRCQKRVSCLHRAGGWHLKPHSEQLWFYFRSNSQVVKKNSGDGIRNLSRYSLQFTSSCGEGKPYRCLKVVFYGGCHVSGCQRIAIYTPHLFVENVVHL